MKTPMTISPLSFPVACLCAGLLALSTTTGPAQERDIAPTAPVNAATSKTTDLEYLFHQLDVNNDGKLTREEFAGITSILSGAAAATGKTGQNRKTHGGSGLEGSPPALSNPAAVFGQLDTDGDKTLSREEFKKIAPLLGIEPAKTTDSPAPRDTTGKAEEKKKDEADKGTNLPNVGSGGSSSGARDTGTAR